MECFSRVSDSFAEAIDCVPSSPVVTKTSVMAELLLALVTLLFSLVWLSVACLSLPCPHSRPSLCSSFLGVRVFIFQHRLSSLP